MLKGWVEGGVWASWGERLYNSGQRENVTRRMRGVRLAVVLI